MWSSDINNNRLKLRLYSLTVMLAVSLPITMCDITLNLFGKHETFMVNRKIGIWDHIFFKVDNLVLNLG